ncbi:MAG: hypothetical protein AAB209_01005 [Bacteroidota bacterium]
MNKSYTKARNGKHSAEELLSKKEIARIARKAARLTPEKAKLLVVPKGTRKRVIPKPAGKPSVSIELIRYAVAKVKAERELLLTYYHKLHAKKG